MVCKFCHTKCTSYDEICPKCGLPLEKRSVFSIVITAVSVLLALTLVWVCLSDSVGISFIASPLKLRLRNHISRGEYIAAVRLAEGNMETCSKPAYSDIICRITGHYTKVAKNYLTCASDYIQEQTEKTKNSSSIKGYNKSDMTLDPHAFEGLLSAEDRLVIDRVNIKCVKTDDKGFPVKFTVTIDVCGEQVVYSYHYAPK